MALTIEDQVKRLEAEVQELKDDREIRELLARYGFNGDLGRTEAFVDLFTDDGLIDLGSGGTLREWEGRAQLTDWISNTPARKQPEKFGKRMHIQGNNLVCHIKGDTALVNSYTMVLQLIDGKLEIMCGTNLWTMKKIDGKWRIKERHPRQLGTQDYRKMLDATPA